MWPRHSCKLRTMVQILYRCPSQDACRESTFQITAIECCIALAFHTKRIDNFERDKAIRLLYLWFSCEMSRVETEQMMRWLQMKDFIGQVDSKQFLKEKAQIGVFRMIYVKVSLMTSWLCLTLFSANRSIMERFREVAPRRSIQETKQVLKAPQI